MDCGLIMKLQPAKRESLLKKWGCLKSLKHHISFFSIHFFPSFEKVFCMAKAFLRSFCFPFLKEFFD